MLFALSPIYRSYTPASRSKIVDEFRTVLLTQEAQLRDEADLLYVEIGGAGALEESFDILREPREEINIELGPVIARLYGVNFLAVQLQDDLTLRPVRLTWTPRFDPALPTILVNYIGGGTNIGNTNFTLSGHYEVIVHSAPPMLRRSRSGDSNTRSKSKSKSKRETRKATTVTLDPATTFVFASADPLLEPVLDLFRRNTS